MKILGYLLLWLWCGHGLAAPALWSANKGERQLWLFGSIHLADERLAGLPPRLLQVLADSELLLLEVDPEALSGAELAPLLTLPPGDNWSTRLGAGLAAELHDEIRSAGLLPLQHSVPWFAAMQLTQSRARELGFASSQGVDLQLQAKARQLRIPIAGLEPPTLVFRLLSSLAEHRLEADFVRHSLDELPGMQGHLDTLLDTWLSGDEAALLALLDAGQSPALGDFIERRLLAERNHHWLARLERLAPRNALLVVGALHLYGEQGLLTLLEQAGYTLNKIEGKPLY